MLTALFSIAIILIPMFFVVSVDNINANLFVSRDEMKKNLRSIIETDLEYKFKESTGCNSFAPKNWDRNSNYVYIDRLNPSFEVAFFRNEIPLVIDNTKFKTSEFSEGTKTVTTEVGELINLELLLFENTGPHNIQNIILYPNIQEDNFTKMETDTYIVFQKDNPILTGYKLEQYKTRGIREDPYRSYTYPNLLGNYSIQINDPKNLFSEVSADAKRVNHKMEVEFEITFAKNMEKSNLVITASDVKKNTMICNIVNALEVTNFSNYEE